MLEPLQIGHDQLGSQNVTWCRDAGCFNLSLTYDVPMEQVQALIAMSDTCEQQITFEVSLRAKFNNVPSYLSVQAGSSEECSFWSEVWMVDQPAGREKGEIVLLNVSFSID